MKRVKLSDDGEWSNVSMPANFKADFYVGKDCTKIEMLDSSLQGLHSDRISH